MRSLRAAGAPGAAVLGRGQALPPALLPVSAVGQGIAPSTREGAPLGSAPTVPFTPAVAIQTHQAVYTGHSASPHFTEEETVA